MDTYLDAMTELLLPQTTVLVGNHNSLCRWLLPDWEADRPRPARCGPRCGRAWRVLRLVTGFNAADQFLENHLARPKPCWPLPATNA